VGRRTLLLACLGLALASSAVRPADEPRKAGLDWWSLQPVCRPKPPAVKNAAWARNPIDAFVLAALEAHGLQPAPVADRATLIRRATFDLHGLPPTLDEIDTFVSDRSSDAWEKVIDRLLASPRYGERWGRHWLDVVRFGESQGFERDKPRDHAWRYRDYVIRSLNADKPYDRFVREQIAGDVLSPVTPDGVTATGFLVCGPWDEVGNEQQGALSRRRVREEELEDMVAAVGQTFLGLTLNCARCHGHKFDPIPQRDYYRVKAALEGVRPGDRPLIDPEHVKERDIRQARVAELEEQVAAVERAGRVAVLGKQGRPAAEGAPRPMARWTFETDARDDLGQLHGTLHGGATVAGGRLRLDGKGAYLATGPLPHALREKTLEAWVTLPTLDQRGGGIISVETREGRTFDAIAFGERQPNKWIAGSELFNRTRDLDAPSETAKPSALVHVAAVYDADGGIAVYRNGVPYGQPYGPAGDNATVRTYPAGESRVLIGLRHTGAGNGFLTGEVAEARLYDRALSAAEVAASFRAGASDVPLAEVLKALTPEQRQARDRALAELAKQRAALAALPPPLGLAYAAAGFKPGPTFVLRRGDVEKPEEEVSAGGLSAVKSSSADFGLPPNAPEGERRRKLAEWLASADNPLTARVMVNRVWQYHFGRGIVGSPSDFGFNGDRPSHPELLDWLADEFVHSGWSVKHLHRLIMASATYRQSARPNAEAAAVDADNRFLWRYPARRLEAEAVRDAMLSVGGNLDPRMGGPSYRPFTIRVFNSTFYDLLDEASPAMQRRTVYRMSVNSAKNALLDSLDCPDPSVKAPRRAVTTTPIQALGLMNNSFVLRQSKQLAGRVAKEAGADAAARVTLAYRLAFGREPTAAERARAVGHMREHGIESLCWVLLNASEFLYCN
jgi:hypothetical protein